MSSLSFSVGERLDDHPCRCSKNAPSAPQKRFAWAIGFVLAVVVLCLVVIRHAIGPVNLMVCAACLALLCFERAASAAWSATPSTRTRRSGVPAAFAR